MIGLLKREYLLPMLAQTALANFNVLVLTPAYGGHVTINFTRSLLKLNNAVWQSGLRASFIIAHGEALVTRARNESLVTFLENPAYTHLLWVDADIGFEPEDVFRLLLSDLDVVAGVYPMKRFDWPVDIPPGMQQMQREDFEALALTYPVNSEEDDQLSKVPDSDGFIEVTEAPTGLMCIKRQVFSKMMAQYPNLRYVPDGSWTPERAALCYRFFDVMVDEKTGRYLSEDYAFCRRWRDMGGRVHVCTQAKLSHTGNYQFNGQFGRALVVRPHDAIGGNSLGRGAQNK